MNIFKGDIIFTKSKDNFSVFEESYIVVEDGKVVDVFEELPEEYHGKNIEDHTGKLIIPSFTDLHAHAPQFANMGLGMDMELLDWLETYTFPEEAKYTDLEYAKKMYQFVVDKVISCGTTRVVFFATIHKEATELLMDLLEESGIVGYVGKVNMDRNSPDILIETTDESIKDTIEWIEETKDKYKHVKPIITPRFVPTCTPELMEALGKMAVKYDIPVQSHLDENLGEIAWVSELHPKRKTYAHVYEYFNQLNSRTLMAHCIYMNDEEIDLMKEREVIAVHCPISNANLSSGIMPLTELIDSGIKVGMGSDVSGGHSPSMLDVIVEAIHFSKLKYVENKSRALSEAEAFYLATKESGSYFGKVGSFEPGYDFDALIIDDSGLSMNDSLDLNQRMQRFIYNGDDRNIVNIYCQGRKIK